MSLNSFTKFLIVVGMFPLIAYAVTDIIPSKELNTTLKAKLTDNNANKSSMQPILPKADENSTKNFNNVSLKAPEKEKVIQADQTCYSVQIQSITQAQSSNVLPSLSYPSSCKLMSFGNDYIVRCGCFETFKKSQASLKELKKLYSEAYITKTYKYKFDETPLVSVDSNKTNVSQTSIVSDQNVLAPLTNGNDMNVTDLNITVKEKLNDSNITKKISMQPIVPVIDLNTTLKAKLTDNNDTNKSQMLPEADENSTKNFNNVSLKEAVQVAIESNFRIKQAKEKIKQANSMVREALAGFLPQVTLSADGLRQKYNGFDIQDYSQAEYSATLSYNLYSSGKDLAQYNKNKLVRKEQEEKYKGTVQEEVNKVVDAYCSVVFGKLSVEVNKRNYNKLVEIYDIVKKKREMGAATKGDESSIAASVSNAKTALTNTESAYNNAKDYYEFLTDKKIDQLYPNQNGFDIKVESFDTIFNDIKANNTDLNILRTQIQEKQKDIKINAAKDLPTVDLTLFDARRYRKGFTTSGATSDGSNTDMSAQLTLTYNLYSGGRTEAQVARVMSEVTDSVYDLEYTTKSTKWDSQKLYNSVLTNTRTLDTLTSEIVASKQMTDAYWERFRLASQDLVTLLQAQRQVNTAELEKLKSEKTRIVDYFNLLTKQGKLLGYFGL